MLVFKKYRYLLHIRVFHFYDDMDQIIRKSATTRDKLGVDKNISLTVRRDKLSELYFQLKEDDRT